MGNSSPLESVFAGHKSLPAEFETQFLANPEQPHRVILEGEMQEIWFQPIWLWPLFQILGALGILVPRQGHNIRATLEVIPGRFPNGEPFHEWNRTFYFDPPLRFNTTVVYDHTMKNIADVVGKTKFLHMVWEGKFHSPDTFTLATVTNAIRVGTKLVYLPEWLWKWTLGSVRFVQRAHEDDDNTVDVDLRIIHPLFKEVFGYRGTFTAKRYPKPGETNALG